MTNKLTLGKNNNFDLKGFLDNQYEIYKKFTPPTHSNTNLEKFDKILMMLVEEMEEFKMAREDNEPFEELKNELVDVIMYTGTLTMVWYDDFKNELEEFVDGITFECKPVDYAHEILGSNMFDLTFSEHFNKLIRIRRNFSERKWHKPVIKQEQEELMRFVLQIISTNMKFLNTYMNQLFYYDGLMETVIERIQTKQDFIINLPVQK